MKTRRGTFWVGILALVLAGSAFADEGLWLFNMPPSQILKDKYKFVVTPEWMDHLRLSSVRFGGGSGSFVSPEGLVLTNHHIGQDAIQQLSTQDRDMMKTGFYARTRAEELKVPGMEVSVLQSIEDVTARVRGAETPEMPAAEAAALRQKEIAALEKEESDRTGLRCAVVNLFSGEMYHLYRYKVFTDVRLVFAPEYLIAFFGGDQDNFTYPRYDLDITLFRLYENDKPYATPHYLKWSTDRVKEGDLILVSGHPGSTGRLLTMAQMEFLRDVSYPWTLANYERRRVLLKEFSKRGGEAARFAQGTLFGLENSLKAFTGYQSGLLDKDLMAKKARDEAELRAAVRTRSRTGKALRKGLGRNRRGPESLRRALQTLPVFRRRGRIHDDLFLNGPDAGPPGRGKNQTRRGAAAGVPGRRPARPDPAADGREADSERPRDFQPDRFAHPAPEGIREHDRGEMAVRRPPGRRRRPGPGPGDEARRPRSPQNLPGRRTSGRLFVRRPDGQAGLPRRPAVAGPPQTLSSRKSNPSKRKTAP